MGFLKRNRRTPVAAFALFLLSLMISGDFRIPHARADGSTIPFACQAIFMKADSIERDLSIVAGTPFTLKTQDAETLEAIFLGRRREFGKSTDEVLFYIPSMNRTEVVALADVVANGSGKIDPDRLGAILRNEVQQKHTCAGFAAYHCLLHHEKGGNVPSLKDANQAQFAERLFEAIQYYYFMRNLNHSAYPVLERTVGGVGGMRARKGATLRTRPSVASAARLDYKHIATRFGIPPDEWKKYAVRFMKRVKAPDAEEVAVIKAMLGREAGSKSESTFTESLGLYFKKEGFALNPIVNREFNGDKVKLTLSKEELSRDIWRALQEGNPIFLAKTNEERSFFGGSEWNGHATMIAQPFEYGGEKYYIHFDSMDELPTIGKVDDLVDVAFRPSQVFFQLLEVKPLMKNGK